MKCQGYPPLDWCFYRLTPSGGTKPRGPKRTDQEVLDYVQKHGKGQSLYIFVEDASKTNLDDVRLLNHCSGFANLNQHLIARLLTVRTEWSKR